MASQQGRDLLCSCRRCRSSRQHKEGSQDRNATHPDPPPPAVRVALAHRAAQLGRYRLGEPSSRICSPVSIRVHCAYQACAFSTIIRLDFFPQCIDYTIHKARVALRVASIAPVPSGTFLPVAVHFAPICTLFAPAQLEPVLSALLVCWILGLQWFQVTTTAR